MDEPIPLKEAAALLGESPAALLKRCQRGTEPGAVKHNGCWHLTPQRVAALRSEAGITEYAQLHAEWIRGMERGIGYKKPISPRGVESHVYGLEKFWLFLENPPKVIKIGYKKGEERPKPTRQANLLDINLKSLQQALGNVPLDREARKCHFSIREKMYVGFRSFYKFLEAKGLRTRADYLDLDVCRPYRIYEEQRPVLTEEALFRVIEINDAVITGRSKDLREHDALMSKIIIYSAAFVGLRNEEIRDLHIAHIDLKRQELSVIDGKGNKNRDVGFNEEVRDAYRLWISKVRRKSPHPNLIVSANGLPLTAKQIYNRVRRAGKAAGVFVNPHALRRTCASVALEHGVPIHHISENFGHTRTSTTEKSYAKANKRQVLNSFKEFRPMPGREVPKVEAPKPAAAFIDWDTL